MKGLKVKIFREGKLSGEGYIRPFPGGTVGARPGSTIISPAIRKGIRICKTFTGKISVRMGEGEVKSVKLDDFKLEVEALRKLGALKTRGGRTYLLIPKGLKARVVCDGFELNLEEEDIVREGALLVDAVERELAMEFRRKPFAGDSRFLSLLSFTLIFYIALHTAILITRAPEINVRRDIPRRFTRYIYEPLQPDARKVVRKVDIPPKKAEVERVEKKEKSVPPPSKKDARKPEKTEVVKRSKPDKPTGREAIRARIASKGVLGILTGRGRAGSSYGSDVLNQLSEVSDIDVKLDKVASLEKPMLPPGKSLVETDIAEVVEESGIGSEKSLNKKIYRTQRGTEFELSGSLEDKSRSAHVISSTISSYLGGIRYVYNGELKKNPSLSGKLTVTFFITPEGGVKEISIKDSNLNWPSLEKKVLLRISHWRFPPSKSGEVRVVFPFLFFPSM